MDGIERRGVMRVDGPDDWLVRLPRDRIKLLSWRILDRHALTEKHSLASQYTSTFSSSYIRHLIIG